MANLFLANQVSFNGVNTPLNVYLNPKRVSAINATTYTSNYTTITFSAALVASNSIAGDINGVAITPVVYATSNANTLSLLATEIATKAGVASAVVSGTRSVIVYPTNAEGGVSATSFAVTLGASQATVTVTQSTADGLTAGEVLYKNADGSMTNAIITTTTDATLRSRANTANSTNNVNVIELTRKNDDGTTTTVNVNVADLVSVYADPTDSADSIVSYMNTANDRMIVMTVDETASAIASAANA